MLDSALLSRPKHGDAPFAIGEVFYSRTDGRGVIRAGNEVFRRVADYDWSQLIGAPHRLIRHPDMPKAVFRLLWDRIQAGKPTGAYVRNKAQDGLQYWVFALVTPIDGGYLSVRVKPSSEVFATIRGEYAAALEREAEGMPPEASMAALLERICALGHADYDDFMAAAMAAELTAPGRAAVRPATPRLLTVRSLVAPLRDFLAEKSRLQKDFDDIRSIPMNLHITASRIETYGGPVATLAESYRLMAADISTRLESVVGTGRGTGVGERMLASVTGALFRIGGEQIQGETAEAARRDPADGLPFDPAAELKVLEAVARQYGEEVNDSLAAIARNAAELAKSCLEMKRQMQGLDSIRVLCRVEAGRLQERGASLSAIIDQLDVFHAEIGHRLDRILGLTETIRRGADEAVEIREVGWASIQLRSAPRPRTPAPRPAPPGSLP